MFYPSDTGTGIRPYPRSIHHLNSGKSRASPHTSTNTDPSLTSVLKVARSLALFRVKVFMDQDTFRKTFPFVTSYCE